MSGYGVTRQHEHENMVTRSREQQHENTNTRQMNKDKSKSELNNHSLAKDKIRTVENQSNKTGSPKLQDSIENKKKGELNFRPPNIIDRPNTQSNQFKR